MALSDADLAVMEAFLAARGEAVPREALLQCLGRRRRRRERRQAERHDLQAAPPHREGPTVHVTLQSKARVGYVFKALLLLAA